MSTHEELSEGPGVVGAGGVGGARGWALRWWRALLGELLASALLVALGAASLLGAAEAPAPLAHGALCFGFLVTTLAEAFGAASGAHMNPAVSLTALLLGRLRPGAAAGYALAQVAGAAAGYALLAALVPAARAPGAGLTLPADGVGAAAAVLLEALLTAPLALLCAAAWAAPGPDPALSLKLGVTVAGLIFAGGPLTGASLNPARSLAPALYHGHWDHHWVYWVGPLGGAVLAVLVHAALRARPPAPHAAGAERLPLHDKMAAC